ncbi:hypothetical protein NT6N_16680 [Oceaniferula spumae]|uniref:Aminotransferase n=1 Tax=Oceaniferula spumae TaxID=2979115 RepID=A0AAT9FL07_9BACT
MLIKTLTPYAPTPPSSFRSSSFDETTYSISLASAEERQQVYWLRHQIYASELGQHAENPGGIISDVLDQENHYIVAKVDGLVIGFISITPPSARSYSIEKYFQRSDLPFNVHRNLYEIRLLSVVPQHRKSCLFLLLAYAAFRWVESHGGTHVCGMGRADLMKLYQRFGLNALPQITKSGDVRYQLMHAAVSKLAERASGYAHRLQRSGLEVDWQLPFPFQKPAPCFHGGAFFTAIGETFQTLERQSRVINADVLDAWFPPAPSVIENLTNNLPWLLRTSPPAGCEGLIDTISRVRGVGKNKILPGAGSSDLIFRAFCHWLTKKSKVLILDPTYGEYCHVLEQVIGCQVTRFRLDPANAYEVNTEALKMELVNNYDLVVLVNPNSPTGRHIERVDLQKILSSAPVDTRIWVDETYMEYVGASESLEQYAAYSENVVVCKSMSKVYALSGARVAYLCAASHQLESLRAITPPWVVGLPSQVAAVRALEDETYYQARYSETHQLREELSQGLTQIGWKVFPSVANFLLCELPEAGADTEAMIAACRAKNLYLRNPGNMGGEPNRRLIRVAVKDADTNGRMLEIIKSVSCRSHQKSVT